MARLMTEEEPEVVYHYTTIDAMMKIVNTASIWATSINYLNDTSEREHYLNLVRNRIEAARGLVFPPFDTDNEIFAEFLNPDERNFAERPFVASFSQEDDSLPQWRSYCPQGNGVAIGFSTECLRNSTVQPNDEDRAMYAMGFWPSISFSKIDYLDTSSIGWLNDDIVSATLEATIDAEQASRNAEEGESTPSIASYFNSIIEGRASFKKHGSFSAEREYRLLVNYLSFHSGLLEYRTTRSTLVPYVSVSIPRRRSSYDPNVSFRYPDHSWFIERVVVGPTANQRLSRDAISSFFRKHDMYVEVVSSAIPYRDW
jgi:hypothetical protein